MFMKKKLGIKKVEKKHIPTIHRKIKIQYNYLSRELKFFNSFKASYYSTIYRVFELT